MYIAVVALTMLILPLMSIAVEHGVHPDIALVTLMGRWFVFWGVGVRLALAGLRQFFQPSFTAREIFHTTSDEALPLVRELGVANFAAGIIALLSLWNAGFVPPSAIYAAIFYGAAGIVHITGRDRSRNENIAMASDLFIAAVLATYVAWMFWN
ncbi:MAG: DUF6790 family protein [Bradyrhizobium sp.]